MIACLLTLTGEILACKRVRIAEREVVDPCQQRFALAHTPMSPKVPAAPDSPSMPSCSAAGAAGAEAPPVPPGAADPPTNDTFVCVTVEPIE